MLIYRKLITVYKSWDIVYTFYEILLKVDYGRSWIFLQKQYTLFLRYILRFSFLPKKLKVLEDIKMKNDIRCISIITFLQNWTLHKKQKSLNFNSVL